MTSQSDPSGDQLDPGLDAVMSERRQLINLAYRLLGSLADAEDVVQEAYARWYALSERQRDEIEAPGAWLTTVASRICLDLLRSARVRRERYVGEWIPEPLPERAEWISGTTNDPADRVTLDESINMALLVVLESMTPAERVTFVLHDVFRYPFPEVAEIVGRTPAACRQLAVSARRRIRDARVPAAAAPQNAAHRPGLQSSVGSQGHQRADRPARPGCHVDRRHRWAGSRLPEPASGQRVGGSDAPRDRACERRTGRSVPGAYGQRPAGSRTPAGRRNGHGDGLRHRRRPDQEPVGGTQPGEAPALGHRLTSVRSDRRTPEWSVRPPVDRTVRPAWSR